MHMREGATKQKTITKNSRENGEETDGLMAGGSRRLPPAPECKLPRVGLQDFPLAQQ